MDDTLPLRLERRDPAKNMQRFYALQVEPNLFGGVVSAAGVGTDRQKRADADGLVSVKGGSS